MRCLPALVGPVWQSVKYSAADCLEMLQELFSVFFRRWFLYWFWDIWNKIPQWIKKKLTFLIPYRVIFTPQTHLLNTFICCHQSSGNCCLYHNEWRRSDTNIVFLWPRLKWRLGSPHCPGSLLCLEIRICPPHLEVISSFGDIILLVVRRSRKQMQHRLLRWRNAPFPFASVRWPDRWPLKVTQ